MKSLLLPIGICRDPRWSLKDLLMFLEETGRKFKVILLDTYLVPVSPSERLIYTFEQMRKESLKKLQDELHAAKVLVSSGKVSFEVVSQMGSPVNVVSRIVKEKGIDCVVMGRDGSLKKDEMSQILDRVSCPIFALGK